MIRQLTYCLFIILAVFFIPLRAQNVQYARVITDTLCSDAFMGRGYTFSGSEKAASFIKDEMKKAGLKKLRHRFTQKFSISINTFPNDPVFRLDSTVLHAGTDIIPAADCPTAKVSGNLVRVNDSIFSTPEFTDRFFSSSLTDKILLLDLKNPKTLQTILEESDRMTYKPMGILIAEDRLMHTLDERNRIVPVFKIKRSSIRNNAQYFYGEITAKKTDDYPCRNVFGKIKGKTDSTIVICAHYDHLGSIGKKAVYRGANDNAAGVAMLLDLARYYKAHPPHYTMVFVAFAAEEAGLKGSKYFTEHPLLQLEKIKFLMNLDLVATGEEGITVVNATVFPDRFKKLEAINEKLTEPFSKVQKRGKAANSDHFWFTEKGVPSFFIYGMGPRKAYHEPEDEPSTLTFYGYNSLFNLLTRFFGSMN